MHSLRPADKTKAGRRTLDISRRPWQPALCLILTQVQHRRVVLDSEFLPAGTNLGEALSQSGTCAVADSSERATAEYLGAIRATLNKSYHCARLFELAACLCSLDIPAAPAAPSPCCSSHSVTPALSGKTLPPPGGGGWGGVNGHLCVCCDFVLVRSG